jgi:hypothetical protein
MATIWMLCNCIQKHRATVGIRVHYAHSTKKATMTTIHENDTGNGADDSNPIAGNPEAHEGEQAELSVIVFDLCHAQTLLAAAEMSNGLKEVAEGLRVAQEVGMRLLFVAMNRKERIVTCVPVANEHTVPKALHALAEVIEAAHHSVAWVFLPESLAPVMMPHLIQMQGQWESSIQGVVA